MYVALARSGGAANNANSAMVRGKLTGDVKCPVCGDEPSRCLSNEAAELPFGVGGIRVDLAVCSACNDNYRPGKAGWERLEAMAVDQMISAGQRRMTGFEPAERSKPQ